MKVEAKAYIEMAKDTVELIVDFVGHTELEHEFIKELFAGEKVQQGVEDKRLAFPTAIGEHDVRVRIPISKYGSLERAKRTMENKRRISAGQPTLQQEEAAKEKAEDDAKLLAIKTEQEEADKKAKEGKTSIQ